MKRIVVSALISIATITSFAQTGNLGDNPEECKKNLFLYTGYLTQKVYTDAYTYWVEAVKVCPEYNANLYDNGIYIMNKLKKGASPERKKSLSESIVWAYEQSIKLFGDNAKINENFGADLIKMGKISKGVEVMKKSIDSSNGETRASSIYYYSNALAVLKNKEKMDCEVLVNEYDRLSEVVSRNEGQNGYDKAQDALDKFLGPCLTCDKLLPVIEKKFEKAKTDDNLRAKVLNTLKKRECTDNTVFKTLIVIDNPNKKEFIKGEWASNGSGVIISKSGHIITNHHVIENTEEIEVEFILKDEIKKFNAEIVKVDKINDLAIIKIVDVNFNGLDEVPYNFKTRSSDVGTKVYAYGYPMALSIMGKEVKVTDGIISSKTGFNGNITTYQITAPIQGGNSGGPLFDEKGNLIGINSSGIRKDVADNVAYSIKLSYILNLIDILPESIELPSSTKLTSLPLTEQIKEISKYVVLIKVK